MNCISTSMNSKAYFCVGLLAMVLLTTMITTMPLPSFGLVNKTNSHSIARHGLEESLSIQQCLEWKGEKQVWHKPYNNRWGRICQFEDGSFGIQIVSQMLDEITSFVRRYKDGTPVRSVDELIDYMISKGYKCVWGCQ